MHEPPVAFVSHKTATRIRLKVPSKKKNDAFFASLVKKIPDLEGVQSVETNPLTGSVLLSHASDPEQIIQAFISRGIFRIGDKVYGRTNLHSRMSETFKGIDLALRDLSGNELDVGGTAFITLIGFGVYQIWRGNVAAIPWYAAGWYALNIFLKTNVREQSA